MKLTISKNESNLVSGGQILGQTDMLEIDSQKVNWPECTKLFFKDYDRENINSKQYRNCIAMTKYYMQQKLPMEQERDDEKIG